MQPSSASSVQLENSVIPIRAVAGMFSGRLMRHSNTSKCGLEVPTRAEEPSRVGCEGSKLFSDEADVFVPQVELHLTPEHAGPDGEPEHGGP